MCALRLNEIRCCWALEKGVSELESLCEEIRPLREEISLLRTRGVEHHHHHYSGQFQARVPQPYYSLPEEYKAWMEQRGVVSANARMSYPCGDTGAGGLGK
jgi:hypothetical protein